jgi:hypothetical protein
MYETEMNDAKERLRDIARAFGVVVGSSTSRIEDGTEVAWAVHAGSDDPDTWTDEETVLAMGAKDQKALLLRCGRPLAAMAIARSLAHRAEGGILPGSVRWVHAADVSSCGILERPSAFLILEASELGIASPDVVVVAGLSWPEALLGVEEARAVAIARRGQTPIARMDGRTAQEAAAAMLDVLTRSTDNDALEAAAAGLDAMIALGVGKLLAVGFMRVYRDPTAAGAARDIAAHLMADTEAVEPLMLTLLDGTASESALVALRLWILEKAVDFETRGHLSADPSLGLPDDWHLTEETIPELEAAITTHPASWIRWALPRLPTPIDPAFSQCRAEIVSQLTKQAN